MKVRATKVTFAGGRAQNPGDVFEVDAERGFNPNCMEKVSGGAAVSKPIVRRAPEDRPPPSGTGVEMDAKTKASNKIENEVELHAPSITGSPAATVAPKKSKTQWKASTGRKKKA